MSPQGIESSGSTAGILSGTTIVGAQEIPAPGTHSWQSIAFVMAIIAIAAGVALLLNQKEASKSLHCHRRALVWVKLGEWFLALVVGATADFYDVFKRFNWRLHHPHPYAPLFAILGCGFLFVSVGHVRDRVKDTAEEEIAGLKSEIEARTKQRDMWVRLLIQIKNIIDAKMKRVAAMAKRQNFTHADFIEALNPDDQVHLIVQAIYSFFSYKLQTRRADAKLRLALYVRDATGKRLEPAFSWDGQKKNCITPNLKEMELGSPEGVGSVVVQCYNTRGDGNIIVIPDCQNEKDFDFFRPEQKVYLRSMVAFKYKTDHEGTPGALVLSLDCDEKGFFAPGESEELKAFFVEMLKRIDYELLLSDVSEKLAPAP